jgi:hypothetical protein
MIKQFRHVLKIFEGFFPVKLLLLNFKKNQILLFFWFLLISMVTGKFGANIGVPYLFLDPEYMGEVGSFKTMIIMGLTTAVFTISYFITCYILDSHRFDFLSSIKFPFIRYSLNNSFFPVLYLVTYTYSFLSFQFEDEVQNFTIIILEILAFHLSFGLLMMLFFTYFGKTNRDSVSSLVSNIDTRLRKKRINTVSVMSRLRSAKGHKYQIRSYIDFNFRVKSVNHALKYDKYMLVKIIDQHHLNAVIVELALILWIFILGQYREIEIFQIPAAASALLFLSFLMMFTGAFSYWLRGWAISSLVILLFLMNYLIKQDIINSNYQAFGLDYTKEKAQYTRGTLDSLSCRETINTDIDFTIDILENWKKKHTDDSLPKIVFVCASGGGQRSAYWTVNTLQQLDSITKGDFFNHTMMYTGASGGLIGSAYYRELKLQQLKGKLLNTHNHEYLDNIGKDLLNPIVFTLVVSDMFLRSQKFEYKGFEYYKGRGYAFEEKLNSNTGGILDRSIIDYQLDEYQSNIPMLLFSPTIINDGRKLFISPQPISYMNVVYDDESFLRPSRVKGVEFRRFFKDQNADSLRYLTALRMSATFPYVTPNIHLPSVPKMEMMDAGLTDNYGVSDAVRFIYTFHEWIEKNTSGVIILSVRDSEKNPKIEKNITASIWNKFFNPIGSLFSNWGFMQDFTNDNVVELLSAEMKTPVKFINFEYVANQEVGKVLKISEKEEAGRASLSWHLTQKEKNNIEKSFFNKNNQNALRELLLLLEADKK